MSVRFWELSKKRNRSKMTSCPVWYPEQDLNQHIRFWWHHHFYKSQIMQDQLSAGFYVLGSDGSGDGFCNAQIIYNAKNINFNYSFIYYEIKKPF
jgi:hypothetical protein